MELTADVTARWNVRDFLEASVLATALVPDQQIIADVSVSAYVTGDGAIPSGVMDVEMTARDSAGGIRDVLSFDWLARRGDGTSMSVTLKGDARDEDVPVVTVSAGPFAARFAGAGTLDEWDYSRTGSSERTELRAKDALLDPTVRLPELVSWERDRQLDAQLLLNRAGQIALIPPAHRERARRDVRRMPVDALVTAALSYVPHRLLTTPPFPGYDFLAEGPSYSTRGKTPKEIVDDIWGRVGIQSFYDAGVLVIRAPGPAGYANLQAPAGSEISIKKITLDAPVVELEGGTRPAPVEPDPDEPAVEDPTDPSLPANSPDPNEREGNDEQFVDGQSPTPSADPAANSVSLSWAAVPGASQYVVERVLGGANPYSIDWTVVDIGSATQFTDTGLLPETVYSYRLRVNATAIAGTEQNTRYVPSETVTVTTLKLPSRVPRQVGTLTPYITEETALGIGWDAPAADPVEDETGFGAADSYSLTVKGSDGEEVGTLSSANRWARFDNLPEGDEVEVEIRSVNAAGQSDVTTQIFQLNVPVPIAPSYEIEITGKTVSLTVSPNDTVTRTIEAELVRSGTVEKSGSVSVPREKGAADALKITLEGEQYQMLYTLRVRSSNNQGFSAWSSTDILTEPKAPEPELDGLLAGFEAGDVKSLNQTREDATMRTTTTSWTDKNSGLIAERVQVWTKAPIVDSKNAGATLSSAQARTETLISITTRRINYEISGWPQLPTVEISETVNYDTGGSGRETGVSRQKIINEYSGQGDLSSRVTYTSKPDAIVERKYKVGEVETVENEEPTPSNTVKFESWLPTGGGNVRYSLLVLAVSLIPTYVIRSADKSKTKGEYEYVQSGARVIESDSYLVSEAPAPVKLSADQRDNLRKGNNLPSITRTSDYPSAKTPITPEVGENGRAQKLFPVDGAGGGGGGGGGGMQPGTGPAPSPTGAAPKGPATGAGDPSGEPGADLPARGKPIEPPRDTFKQPHVRTYAGSPVLSASLPWVTSKAGLRKYAQMLASTGGTRYVVTETVILPLVPPPLDLATEVSASGSNGQFTMTVVSETRDLSEVPR